MYRYKFSCRLFLFHLGIGLLLTACKAEKGNTQNFKYNTSAEYRSQLKSIDRMMDLSYFDTAQIYLNQMKGSNNLLKPSLVSYVISSRQAEIYYYNNLHELGIQESKKALGIALSLKDSTLSMDAYNFCGLFYMNMDSMDLSIQYFYKGLAQDPSNSSEYLQDILLSRPFHIYGNLAEAYFIKNELDSAIFYSKMTQKEAIQDKNKRGEIVSLIQMGDAYLKKGEKDSALFYLTESKNLSIKHQLFDLTLNSLASLAEAETSKNHFNLSNQILEEGFKLQKNHPQINSYYKILFLEKASEIYSKQKDFEHLSLSLQQLTKEQSKTKEISNKQYLSVFLNGLQNESKLLNMEVEKAVQSKKLANIRLYIILLVILVLIALFITYRYYTQQKLKIADLRNKISQDLHDEIGSTLSGIAMYSYIIKNQIKSGDETVVNESLYIIEKNATDMVKKLSDIVWSVNPLYDNLGQLFIRLYEFLIELAQVNQIQVHSSFSPELEKIKLTMIQRKNLYLICKEAINNAVKHSACQNIYFIVFKNNPTLTVSIKDDGSGIDNTAIQGNGLVNMDKRAQEMKAQLNRSSSENGTEIIISFKIT